MIPVGAQYTDAQRHEMEGERGAMAVRRATNKAVPYLLPLVAAPATAVLAPALTSAGEAYSAWSAANPFLSATLNAGIESAFIGDVANRRLIQGEHPTYGQGGDILDKYVLPAS